MPLLMVFIKCQLQKPLSDWSKLIYQVNEKLLFYFYSMVQKVNSRNKTYHEKGPNKPQQKTAPCFFLFEVNLACWKMCLVSPSCQQLTKVYRKFTLRSLKDKLVSYFSKDQIVCDDPCKKGLSLLSKVTSDLEQKCTQLLKPSLGTVFHALSHGLIHFARNVRSKKHFLICWNYSTVHQKIPFQRF